jgi:threonine dehydratase
MIRLSDIYSARPHVYAALRPTPLLRHPLLCQALGTDVWIKHENHQVTGAFKVRGGLNLVARLTADERARGLITASTGNHGQSIAFACHRAGVPCTVVVPLGNNPEKNAAMRGWGAEVTEHGRDFDEARELVEALAASRGLRYVHSANEPTLIAGVGTYALEIFEELPQADVVFVPIGGGSGACGLVTVRNGLGSRARIIGVQASGADAFARSWRTGQRVIGERADTFAEGVATRVTFDLPWSILRAGESADGSDVRERPRTIGSTRRGLDDIRTVTDAELEAALRLALETTHNLAEGAGVAALAAAVADRDALAGLTVVCIMSGGNLATETLRRVLTGSG